MGIKQIRSDMRDYGMDEDVKSVDRMAHEMLKKLFERKNRRKHHWSKYSQNWLLHRLRQETGELTRAVESGRTDDIVRESADVANFAMMIADNAIRKAKEMSDG